jgi:polyisoprenoid-binding protein YceI
MKTLNLIVLAAALAVSPACKKKKTNDQPPPTPASGTATTDMGSGSSMTPPPPDPGSGSGSAMMGSGSDNMGSGSAAAGSGSAAAAEDPNADYVKVLAEHAPDKKPDDPVNIKFEKFTVKKASFKDPNDLTGGTATIEVDLASLKSGSDKRDKHLNTADYIDTSKYTTMTIDVSGVKKKGDKHYTANAKVKLRGMEKTYPVEFDVVDAKEDWVKVKGEKKFARLDFKVGKEKLGPDEAVGQDLTVQLQLTLKKS